MSQEKSNHEMTINEALNLYCHVCGEIADTYDGTRLICIKCAKKKFNE